MSSYIVSGVRPSLGVQASLPFMDAVVWQGTAAQAEALERAGATVMEDRFVPVPSTLAAREERLEIGARTIGADQAWAKGLTGKGVGVAILDTGMAPHPTFKKRIVAFKDVVNNQKQPYDDHGHGTHVTGIARGVAPEADLIGVKVLTNQGGRVSDILKGMQWALDNRARYHIGVLNLSFGVPVNSALDKDPMALAVEKATEAGILCVVAAGNEGPGPKTITTPARAPSALSVGAVDDKRTSDPSDDVMAKLSGRGPVPFDGLAKPDVVAPGMRIRSTSMDMGTETRTGTSMASPFGAGSAALLLQQDGSRTPAELKALLMDTALPLTGETDVYAQGRGLLQVGAAAGWTGNPTQPT